jgi:hypothetical protein
MNIRLTGNVIFRSLIAVALVSIVVELGAIWSELRGVRHEQVKNALYAMRPDNVERIRSMPRGDIRLRQLSGQSVVSVILDDPLPVRINGTADPIPVEIQR